MYENDDGLSHPLLLYIAIIQCQAVNKKMMWMYYNNNKRNKNYYIKYHTIWRIMQNAPKTNQKKKPCILSAFNIL